MKNVTKKEKIFVISSIVISILFILCLITSITLIIIDIYQILIL